MTRRVEVAVIGGGLAGLAATAAFLQAGREVVCIDPSPPPAAPEDAAADLRSTAILEPGRMLLDEAGVWPRLAPYATALDIMRIIALDPAGAVQREADFRAEDIGQAHFGWNLPNWRFRLALADALPERALLWGRSISALWTRSNAARLMLSDGSLLDADLVVAADGRGSAVRQMLSIGVKRHDYGQCAVVFSVTHPSPHENASTEFHASGGPFTLVPIADQAGQSASAVVWMTDASEARWLMTLDDEALADAATARSASRFGRLTPVSRRAIWPIIMQRSEALTARRVVLIAEAAHVVPPIGAQGLNMSLADIAALMPAMRSGEALGEDAMCRAYARTRAPDIRLRMAGIDALNRAAMTGQPKLRQLRSALLGTMHGIAPLRQGLMRLGLGAR